VEINRPQRRIFLKYRPAKMTGGFVALRTRFWSKL
jgi:hypothetical protein